ncbi:MAG: hypothetical protein KIS63_16165, partial [Caldilineales bacterium]|nr:hypothetical protein [Caldilineales bacterium]
MIGKERRMSRLFVGPRKRCLLSPLDHGGWLGPVKGLDRPRAIVEQVIAGGANAILASPGFLRAAAPALPPQVGLVLRVSLTAGLSAGGTQETPIAAVETALRLDADAVAVSVFFGREGDLDIYRWLAGLIQACAPYEMPVVAEMMPPEDRAFDAAAIAHAARIGMEIGADGAVAKNSYGVLNLAWQAAEHGAEWAALIQDEIDGVRAAIQEAHGVSLKYLIWAGMGGSAEDKAFYIGAGLARRKVRIFLLDS